MESSRFKCVVTDKTSKSEYCENTDRSVKCSGRDGVWDCWQELPVERGSQYVASESSKGPLLAFTGPQLPSARFVTVAAEVAPAAAPGGASAGVGLGTWAGIAGLALIIPGSETLAETVRVPIPLPPEFDTRERDMVDLKTLEEQTKKFLENFERQRKPDEKLEDYVARMHLGAVYQRLKAQLEAYQKTDFLLSRMSSSGGEDFVGPKTAQQHFDDEEYFPAALAYCAEKNWTAALVAAKMCEPWQAYEIFQKALAEYPPSSSQIIDAAVAADNDGDFEMLMVIAVNLQDASLLSDGFISLLTEGRLQELDSFMLEFKQRNIPDDLLEKSAQLYARRALMRFAQGENDSISENSAQELQTEELTVLAGVLGTTREQSLALMATESCKLALKPDRKSRATAHFYAALAVQLSQLAGDRVGEVRAAKILQVLNEAIVQLRNEHEDEAVFAELEAEAYDAELFGSAGEEIDEITLRRAQKLAADKAKKSKAEPLPEPQE